MERNKLPKRPKKHAIDFYLLFVLFCLLAIGLLMVFSASSVNAFMTYKNTYHFFARQAVWVILGLGGLFFLMHYDYYRLKKLGPSLIFVSILLLIGVLIFGKNINGATSWYSFGGFSFQPTELLKPILVISLAGMLVKKQNKIGTFIEGMGPSFVLLGILVGLVMAQPDMGTTMILVGITFVMLLIAGANLWYFGIMGTIGSLLAFMMIWTSDYRRDRLLNFLDPWKDALDSGYQLVQSLYAIGSGGAIGLGLGHSKQKFAWLPEEHNDFIFSIISEELGFVGGFTVIALFAVFAWRGYSIAKKAPDSFALLVAGGLTSMIMMEAVINLAVVTGSMPVTGMTLPFVSYGGSSLLFKLSAMGILLNISRYTVETHEDILASPEKKVTMT